MSWMNNLTGDFHTFCTQTSLLGHGHMTLTVLWSRSPLHLFLNCCCLSQSPASGHRGKRGQARLSAQADPSLSPKRNKKLWPQMRGHHHKKSFRLFFFLKIFQHFSLGLGQPLFAWNLHGFLETGVTSGLQHPGVAMTMMLLITLERS